MGRRRRLDPRLFRLGSRWRSIAALSNPPSAIISLLALAMGVMAIVTLHSVRIAAYDEIVRRRLRQMLRQASRTSTAHRPFCNRPRRNVSSGSRRRTPSIRTRSWSRGPTPRASPSSAQGTRASRWCGCRRTSSSGSPRRPRRRIARRAARRWRGRAPSRSCPTPRSRKVCSTRRISGATSGASLAVGMQAVRSAGRRPCARARRR